MKKNLFFDVIQSFLFLACIVLLFGACKEDNESIIPTKPGIYIGGSEGARGVYWKNDVINYITGTNEIVFLVAVLPEGDDIYAAGNIINATGFNVPAFWKNGVVTKLSDGTINTQITNMTVSKGDVHTVGYEIVNGNQVAKYWKNGEVTFLPNGTTATSVFVLGSDIYISGSNLGMAKYWKNGVSIDLTEGSASAIIISGNDVYVAGTHKINGTNKILATYWKNGVSVDLPGSFDNFATGIVVDGSDVYLSGFEVAEDFSETTAKYWKNGVATILSKSGKYSRGSNITISGNDVYVIGFSSLPSNENLGMAVYWKNGESRILSSSNSGSGTSSIVIID